MDAGLKKGQNLNPMRNANPLSLVTFWWCLDIFRLGFSKDLDIEDLYDALPEHKSDFLGDKLEKLWYEELQQSKARKREPSLLRVLVRCFGASTLLFGLTMAVSEFMFQMTQPIFLGGLIRYFSPRSDLDYKTALLYAAGISVCSLFNIFIKNPTWLGTFHMGMKMRVGVCSLIYRKGLRLSKTALGDMTVGQAVNLLSNDVARFDRSFLFLSFLFIGPLQTAIVVYLMWDEIGVAAIIGVATILLVMPIQAGLGKMLSTLRMRSALRTDERLRFMNEIIIGIQLIKMYAWEKPFADLIAIARVNEIKAVRATNYVRGLLLSFLRFGTKVAVFGSIVTYVLQNDRITAEQMFVVTAYFNIIKQTMTDFFALAIAEIAESSVSVTRIQAFLLREEIANEGTLGRTFGSTSIYKKIEGSVNSSTSGESTKIGNLREDKSVEKVTGDAMIMKAIDVVNVTAKWTEDLPENTLSNVNLHVRPRMLLAVIGPVGSGKTSLLHAILKELPVSKGSILVKGSISYASQEPWLFTGSVRQNILFGEPMNTERYKQVVKACALEQDFQQLPHRDRTIVGERGVTLSGGQRARINLARAVYKDADVYLLDDPLSAVDAHVGRHLFDDCICGYLQNRTRVLVTHQLQYLQKCDNIVVLKNGEVEAMATFTNLQSSALHFAEQLELETGQSKNILKKTRRDSQHSLSSRNRYSSESSQISSLVESEPEISAEMRTRGSVGSRVYKGYFSAGRNFALIIFVLIICILAQLSLSGGDYWMSYWSNVEEQRLHMLLFANSSLYNTTDSPINHTVTHENASSVNIISTNSTEWPWLPTTETCIYVYSGFVTSTVVLLVSSLLCALTVCMKASTNLHNSMFSNITRATMWFFNNNPSGQILNRFSKDMGSIDDVLPMTLLDCYTISLSLLAVVTIVAIVNVWLLLPTAVMFCIFCVLRVYYVATSRSVKRLEGIARSPVFSHLNASLQGLTTIRALNAETLLIKEFDSHQDLHSSAWFMYVTTSRAFAVWLDSTCLMYITLVTFSFLMGGVHYGGDVGLAITQAIGLTGIIQWGMRQSAEMENQMTSVERVLEYTTIEKEPSLETASSVKLKDDWPSQGAIVFDRVFLAYSKDEQPVLKNVNFTINPCEKVGIVGRTGAGKSSLISALFRLVDLRGGSIQIDSVDISKIGLHDLRSKISIIPQEPFLFTGSLRKNLDPFDKYSDAALLSALEEVELKQAVDELPAGLNHKVLEYGSNFSVGQRQLLCLARAIIRNNKILVLDEATANVDPKTDELIQRTIRRKFADCTVLTIAHRLHTVVDSDRIIVMDAGSVVECDHPYNLLKNTESVMYQMVQQTGSAMAESLFRMASASYNKILKRRDNV